MHGETTGLQRSEAPRSEERGILIMDGGVGLRTPPAMAYGVGQGRCILAKESKEITIQCFLQPDFLMENLSRGIPQQANASIHEKENEGLVIPAPSSKIKDLSWRSLL